MKLAVATFAGLAAAQSPVTRVVELVQDLKKEIEADGAKEQAIYDKFACWCEDTTAEKSAAIDSEKELITSLSQQIVQLKGERGTLAADLAQLEKDIAANKKSQEEAIALRQKEHNDYASTRMETEQAVNALYRAVQVLAGAGEGPSKAATNNASTLQEAQMLSIVAGVRNALRMLPKDSMTNQDFDQVQTFVNNPESFSSKDVAEPKAFLQNNPFGDYAPASTKIQGILKNMYDTFVSNLESMSTDEATSQHSFEDLIATKQDELQSLEATLTNKTAANGEKGKQLAESKKQKLETEKVLAEDEEFFADTKESCQNKADQWAERSRLRTEELGGIEKAISILNSPEAQATFSSSATTLMQLSSKKNIARESAFGAIKTVAKKNHSLRLAALAATVRTGGHFDQVIAEVDKMITILREEEQEDISVRDACQKKMNELDATKANLETKKDRLEGEKSRVEAKNEQMKKELDDTKKAITDQEKTMEDALNQRNQEHDTYIQALKDDEAAVKLIGQAVAAMSAFYGNNQLTMGLIQSSKADPKPETWSKPYGGRSSESKGLVAIMEMLKEDIVKEIGESKTAETEASAEFVKLRNAGDKMLKGLNQTKVTIEKGIADNESTIADLDKELGNTSAAHADTDAMDKTLSDQTCAWIETSFEARRSARKSEVEGLQQAKAMLAGANDEDTDRMDAQLE